MTKKDYQKFAGLINDRLNSYTEGGNGAGDDGAIQEIITIAHGLANIFSKDNPRFDRKKFLTACGGINV